ncbi:hypothetical protein BCR35DRAFT_310413 [Leucosporidium creatinivorum]|uniref:Uncharacterized protein n=1 Tax=Leucosporidium creatinivorum TaxID=106004 RepID=A0A1Y2D4N9_9BASI|nr:hypothetical protein BCR35DRAFT_310413 [Leucosporidium creatinivorum]
MMLALSVLPSLRATQSMRADSSSLSSLDLFYTGPPTHFTRLSEIMTEIESDAISPEAFLEDAELHIRCDFSSHHC